MVYIIHDTFVFVVIDCDPYVQYGKRYKSWDTSINFVSFIPKKKKCCHLFLYFVFVFISYIYFLKGFLLCTFLVVLASSFAISIS